MMQAYTEEQRAELIQACRDTIRFARDYPEVEVHMAQVALAALAADPVYQVEVHGGWADVSEEDFEAAIYKGEKTRNLYTTPPATAPAVSVGWIKCSERMPERHAFVTGYTDYDGVIYQMAVDDNGVWYTKDSDWSMTEVTHWMPAPAAPEVE